MKTAEQALEGKIRGAEDKFKDKADPYINMAKGLFTSKIKKEGPKSLKSSIAHSAATLPVNKNADLTSIVNRKNSKMTSIVNKSENLLKA